MSIVGWTLGCGGIGITATIVVLMRQKLTAVARRQSPRPRLKVLLLYLGCLLLGLAMFGAAILVGRPH
ncbi:MAG TPA: hypothetical protein VHX64_01010 [Caulobacteraceae bacterium]|nr:hypothetical protein [Caulobacteraceae bacterium]